MKQNMGTADRIIRLIAGIVLVDLAVIGTASGFGRLGIWILALVFLSTASIGFCPIYAIFGFGTKRGKKTTD
ncbi:MAG: DUF2892 domain-containing protein [Puia sp.]